MARKKTPEGLSKIRRRQRSHAKKRFQQRFDLVLNRDRIHEIELEIGSSHAVAVESKNGKTNYLVEVEGNLVAVGYDPATHRVVTALPNDYLQTLPSEKVLLARLKLLRSEQERVIADIVSGTVLPLHQDGSSTFYEVTYEGLRLKVGYDSEKNGLVPWRRRRKSSTLTTGPDVQSPGMALNPAAVLGVLDLEQTISDAFRQQVRDGTSRFLWRFSKTVTFQKVQWSGEKRKVGYSRTRDVFYAYIDPPEEMVELRSSLQLLDEPPEVIAAVSEIVRTGQAELLGEDDEHKSYRAEWNDRTYYFDVSGTDQIGPWRNGKVTRPTPIASGPALDVR